MEGDRMDLTIRGKGRYNACKGVVRSVSFDKDWSIWRPMGKDRSGSKGLLERLKGGVSLGVPAPGGILVGKVGKRDYGVGIIEDETSVEVGES
jgi:hypothetical protein